MRLASLIRFRPLTGNGIFNLKLGILRLLILVVKGLVSVPSRGTGFLILSYVPELREFYKNVSVPSRGTGFLIIRQILICLEYGLLQEVSVPSRGTGFLIIRYADNPNKRPVVSVPSRGTGFLMRIRYEYILVDKNDNSFRPLTGNGIFNPVFCKY